MLLHGWGESITDDDAGTRAARSAIAVGGSVPMVCCSSGSTRLDETHLSMVLLNADGSRAEMSGNGIRCLVQAAFQDQGRTGPETLSRLDRRR